MSGEGSAAAAPTRRPVPLAVAPPPGNPRFGGLDALRGMAAIAVVVTHCAAYTNNLPTTTDHSAIELVYLRVGQLGVCMFFALSGFLLYRPFLAAQIEGGRPQPFGAYARRRVLRVVPAYWFALTVLSIVPGLAGMFDSGWWQQYLFLRIYSPNPLASGLPQTWSVCIEVGIYFLLPLMVLGIGWVVARAPRKAQPAWALAILGCIGLLSIGLIGWGYLGHHFLLVHLAPSYLWWFCAGMALAVITVHPPARLRGLTGWARAHPGGCWAVALVPFALALWLGPFGPAGKFDEQELVWFILGPLVGLPLLAPAVFVARGGWPRRLMRRRTVMWLGLVSYGIFLWHVGILIALKDIGVTAALTPNGIIPLFVLVFPISVGCAAVSYYWVERPFYALKNRRLLPRFRGRDRSARARA